MTLAADIDQPTVGFAANYPLTVDLIDGGWKHSGRTRKNGRPWPDALPTSGAQLAHHPDLDMEMVLDVFAEPWTFFSICEGVREDESTGMFVPTAFQRLILGAGALYPWIDVNKHRQSKTSTPISIGVILRDGMYLEGVNCAIMAEKRETADTLFERIIFAYERLPPELRAPLAKTGQGSGVRHLRFWHGGSIRVITMGSKTPAVGKSLDRVHISEFGEVTDQAKASTQLFPAFNKRPNARVFKESTPGRSGTHGHRMWLAALEGKSRYTPIHLQWFKDPTCREIAPREMQLTEEEQTFAKRCPGITYEHMAFRRKEIATTFAGDMRLFESKYPPGPLDGWLGSLRPAIPQDVVQHLINTRAVNDAHIVTHDCGVKILVKGHPLPGRQYMGVADPGGFGAKGDPSALSFFDRSNGMEVAAWAGREDPGMFAGRIERSQKFFKTPQGWPLVAVESNAQSTITSLRDAANPALFWTDEHHPGWYATRKANDRGLTRLVTSLRDGTFLPTSQAGLYQLYNYDGSPKQVGKAKDSEGEGHHFDRARVYLIAADLFELLGFIEAVGESDEEDEALPPEMRLTWDMVFADDRKRNKSKDLGAAVWAMATKPTIFG